MKKFTKFAALGMALALATGTAAACSSSRATTSDMGAYTVGTGADGADANVHNVYYPGQQFTQSPQENVFYFPMNARNIILKPGSTDKLANGENVSAVTTYTSTGTQVSVPVRMDWTLNQDPKVLKDYFIPLCKKYQCASTDINARNDNFSTQGWTLGLLGENATPTFIEAVKTVIRSQDDSAWKDPTKKDVLNQAISTEFMKAFHANTGSTADIFCGSGDVSGWNGAIGTSTFKCGPVRITLGDIVPSDTGLLDIQARQAKAEAEKVANQKTLEAARAKYGNGAESVLGDLDRIAACKAAGVICIFGGNNVGVNVTPPATK
jgi:hypothetical protein